MTERKDGKKRKGWAKYPPGKRQTTERAGELGSLGGFGPEELEQLLRLRGLLLKHLLAKFESGVKITFMEVSSAVTLLRRAGLIDLQDPPDEASEEPEEAAETPETPEDGPQDAQDAPGPIEGEDATGGAAPVRVMGSNGQMLTLPFPARGQ